MGSSAEAATEESSGPGRTFYLALAGLAAVGVVTLLLARGGGGPEPIGPLSQADVDVEPDSSAWAAARGPEDAPVTLMEFADYQCSHCARFAALPGPAIRRDYVDEGLVRMVLYDFPLSQGTNAIPAALAARCAGAQGAYWEMHDRLFAHQREWAVDESPEDRFAGYAREVGLDMEAFNSCYSDRAFLRDIMASRRFGETLGVGGTPAIYVNGTPAESYSYQALQALIEAELDSVRGGAGQEAAAAGETAGGGPGA